MSSSDAYKICPTCDGEYLPETERCADCGEILVLDSELCHPDETDAAAAVSPFAAEEELVCIRVAGASWVQRLAERFEAERIPYRIDMLNVSYKGRSKLAARGELPEGVALSVRPIDVERATQIDQDHLRYEVPGIEELMVDEAAMKCPACAADLGEAEESCSVCGLSFV